MYSKFLPPSFDPHAPTAVIAGKGRYPELIVEHLRALHLPVRLIAFEGETPEALRNSFEPESLAVIKVGQVGHLLKALKRFRAKYAVMAGQITPRRLFKGLTPDVKALLLLARLKERNATTIFGALAEEIHKLGVVLLDARSFLDNALATVDPLTTDGWKLSEKALQHGIHIAREMARLDVGQGVVVSNGTVLAVEAFEGTNAMLRRASQFESKEALFVKTSKPNQDYRFDVPVIGLRTLEILVETSIRYVALEAEKTLILDKPQVLEAAQAAGIFLFGYT